MGESVAVTIIVIVLLILGVVFWNNVSSSDIEGIGIQTQELSVIEIANLVPDLPELQCSESGVSQVKCLDKYKAFAMNGVTRADYNTSIIIPEMHSRMLKYYNEYFGNSKITLMTIYPAPATDPNNPNGNIYDEIVLYDVNHNEKSNPRTIQISLPVNIYNVVAGTTEYGLIIVEGYYKG
jgi:hypothetical protein